MDILDQLAVALGFATLAGVNLYLTAFVAGIAIRFNLVALAPEFHELAVLGEWPVLAASGLLLVIELGADKLPWVDSLWDTFHTLIRPIGGALLAISAVGSTSAEYDAIIALVAGSASMVSHGFKASSRLLINNSPEPFSNAAVSTAEDVAVLGGLALMSIDPRITAVLCLVFLTIAVFTMPRIWRRLKGFYWLIGQNAFGQRRSRLSDNLTPQEDLALAAQVPNSKMIWSVQVVAGKTKNLGKLRPWSVGKLIAIEGESDQPRLLFLGRAWRKPFSVELTGDAIKITHERGLLSEHLSIHDRAGNFLAIFRVPRKQGELAGQVLQALRVKTPTPKLLPA